MNIIIPIINTGIGNFIMALPLLKNIEENTNLKPVLIFNKQVYKDIFDLSFLSKDRFNVILENNVSSLNFWINLRKQSKIIISPTVGIKALVLWKSLLFEVYSKPLVWKNKFWNIGIKTFGIPKDHEVVTNIKVLDRFYQDYSHLKQQIQIYEPRLIVKNFAKEKVIFIHPGFDGNSILPKDWGLSHWLFLIKELLKLKKDYRVKIIIGPGFEERFKDDYFRLAAKFPNVNVLYKLKFSELITELAKGELLINTDSGIGHLAGALGLKTITLFGPADENQSRVFSKKAIVIRANQSRPCYTQGIWTRECMDLGGLKDIKVADILHYLK